MYARCAILIRIFLLPAIFTLLAALPQANAAGSQPTNNSIDGTAKRATHTSAVTRILCVNVSGGVTSAPCENTAAYTRIQAAVDAASDGDEIRIAQGTYTESSAARVVSILSKSLTLRGGYTSADWSNSSGAATVLDGQYQRQVILVFQASAAFERLTITRGNNKGGSGGGIETNQNSAQSFTLTDSIVFDNRAKYAGGGLFVVGGNNATLIRTQVISNTADEDGGGFYGYQLTAADTTFARNQAQRNGGGINAFIVSAERTQIYDNAALTGDGGGLYFNPSSLGGTTAITGTTIFSNTASRFGGGIYLGGVVSAQLIGTVIANNQALHGAAFVAGTHIGPAQLNLTNVTISSAALNPRSAIQLGILNPSPVITMQIANTVVTSHTVGIVRPGNSSLTGDYNDFFGNSSDQQVNGSDTPLPFAHIVSAEPHFVDLAENDFHLLSNSPLIDVGDPGGDYRDHYDIDGDLIPLNGRADIGADEYSKTQVLPPAITTLEPGSIAAGSPALTLTVTGAHFADGATITWNGSDRVTTFISDSQLEALIPEADLARAGTIFVAVRNPDSSMSAVQPFIITPYTKYLPLLQR